MRKGAFFLAHWPADVKNHLDGIKKGATIDMSDLEKDPVVLWQRK